MMTPHVTGFRVPSDQGIVPSVSFPRGIPYPGASYMYTQNMPQVGLNLTQERYQRPDGVVLSPTFPQQTSYSLQPNKQEPRGIAPLVQGYFDQQITSPVYPAPQGKPISTPINPNISSYSLSPGICNQNEYLRQLPQGIGDRIERPWWMWCIGWIDILSAGFHTALIVYHILFKPISDPENYIWRFFVGFLAIVARFLQGLGMLVGLKSEDDSNTLWYCKVWFACQVLFVIVSILELLYFGILYGAETFRGHEDPLKIVEVVLVCLYRLTSFIMVKVYITRLKVSVDRVLGGAGWRERLREETQSDDQRIGESSFCGPTIALIMSL